MQHILVHARRVLVRIEETVARHPRRLSAAVATLLLGSGMAAFGLAPTQPDAEPVLTRIVTETVESLDVGAQLNALDQLALTLYRSDLVRTSDTADSLLARLGIDDPQAAQFLRSDPVAQDILRGRSGKMVQASIARDGAGKRQLERLIVRGPAAAGDSADHNFTRITVERQGERLVAFSQQAPLQLTVQTGSGLIESSLFAAADNARIPDAVTMQLADIFGSEIDFRRDLRRGDTFAVVYEALSADGEPITWGSGSGRVLSARFVNRGETQEAIWFQPPGSRGGYYSPDGKSKAHLFLNSPLAFSRVTSGFAMRFHPILQAWRQHKGVDYAAPTGTPVRALGDAVVEFAGRQNGYGNVVQLRHGGNRSTVYAHLSRIDVKVGQHITQAQTIGAVGSTGWATGPHLHFEFKVGGQQVDPVKVARSSETVTLTAAAKPQFQQTAQTALALLARTERPEGVHLARME